MRQQKTPKGFAKHVLSLFLGAYAKTGNVTTAAEKVGFSRATAYRYRDADPDFAAAWDEARAEAGDRLKAEAIRRGVEGWDEPVFYQGEVCGHIRRYSDGMLGRLLEATLPEFRRRVDVSAKVQHTPIDMAAVEATNPKDATTTRNELLARHRMLEGSEN